MKVILWTALVIAGLMGASPITFTLSTTGSGSFNGTSFSDNTLTITQVADTANILNCTGPWSCGPDVVTNTVSISGVGSGVITDFSFFFDDPTNNEIGVFDDSISSILLEESNSAFGSYNLQSGLGPIFDTITISSFSALTTSGGNLTFTGNSLDATFTATTAPEPGSFALLLLPAILFHVWRSRTLRRVPRIAVSAIVQKIFVG